MSDDHPEAAVAEVLDNPLECTCEYVDIGVGHQKVAETPDCPRCTAWGMACAIVKALHGAGHLLPPGGRRTEEYEDERLKRRRIVYVGPWEPVPCKHSSRWAPAPRDGVRTWHCNDCPETWTEAVA